MSQPEPIATMPRPDALLLPLCATAETARTITPTDVSQFVRLEQCERFLRLRLGERAGQAFMKASDVAPQSIPPLLTLSGSAFEVRIENAIRARYDTHNFAEKAQRAGNRQVNNQELAQFARELVPGHTRVLFQPRLELEVDGWLIRGDADLIRFHREGDGTLDVLITDMKSTTTAKVEHRLQVAFYHLMLTRLFARESIAPVRIQTAILYRGGTQQAGTADEKEAQHRDAALQWFGLDDSLLEVVADPHAYLQAVGDLVTGPESTARRVLGAAFEDLPFALSYKCDGCLYNEFCLKWTAENDDLSLLPHLSVVEKQVLRNAGVKTVCDLAVLKDLRETDDDGPQARRRDLIAAPGQEPLVRRLATTWPVGPRLDELVHRARAYCRHVKKQPLESLGYIPSKGYGSLPHSDAQLNPNLVRVYIDTQHDYLQDRLYLVGALVEACEAGVPTRSKSIVYVTDGPPDADQEKRLLVTWTRDLLQAVVDLAAPDSKGASLAPVHLVFYNRFGFRLLLEALGRNFQDILGGSPPLYDFFTQFAAFESPLASFLEQEIQDFRNYPLLCQSLQGVAAYLGFDWNTPAPYQNLFHERLFDYVGKLKPGDENSEWYTRRARFSSQIPLEYAYAAWQQLPEPPADKDDPFAAFQAATIDTLRAFHARRLEALSWIAAKLPPNKRSEKPLFRLPDLANYTDKARTLAHALGEFVTIERHVTLNEWKSIRHAPPERRVLMGETLLVRYDAEGPLSDIPESEIPADWLESPISLDENEISVGTKSQETTELELPEGFLDTPDVSPNNAMESESPKGNPLGDISQKSRIRLRVETTGLDCDLEESLRSCKFRPEDRLVLSPRIVTDERLPENQRTFFTPTPGQLLYGQRVAVKRIEVDRRDSQGRAIAGYVEVDLQDPRSVRDIPGFVFGAREAPLNDGNLYTLDPCPNDWMGYFCAKVIKQLCQHEDRGNSGANTLYQKIAYPDRAAEVSWPIEAEVGQSRFLAGLDAMHKAGALHPLELGKQHYIGRHGSDPILLVQGPPGTGKSYATAFAIFARLQGALAANQHYRVIVSCKTHAATDELLRNLLKVQILLGELRAVHPGLFADHFDERMLNTPIFRFASTNALPEGAIGLEKYDNRNHARLMSTNHFVLAATPGGVYRIIKDAYGKELLGHHFIDCLVLDEASQMNLPEAIMAALPLKPTGQIVVVGDHRQMPPIIKHDWDTEPRRTFQQFRAYSSLYETVHAMHPPLIQFTESFRLHSVMADFLRQEIYRHDGIEYFSRKQDVLPSLPIADDFVAAVLRPEYPLVVVVHDECDSQTRNEFEQALITPIIKALCDPALYNLDPREGLGIVVPHRAQRAALQAAFPNLDIVDDEEGTPLGSAIDTVERFQGGERSVILVTATESNRAYLLAASDFILEPRRLTVALSRAKRKLILVASRSIFELFSTDEETFVNSQLWKDLMRQTSSHVLWQGSRDAKEIAVFGCSETTGSSVS